MPEVPKKITVDLAAKKLLIDGEEFPWVVAGDGPQVVWPGLKGHALVTVTIPADGVQVVPSASEKSCEQEVAERALSIAMEALAAAKEAGNERDIRDARLKVFDAQATLECVDL